MSTAGPKIIFVKNLDYGTDGDTLYEIFGKFGQIRQIRLGTDPADTKTGAPATKGTAYIVYEESKDAKMAVEQSNGRLLQGHYIVVTFHKAQALVKVQERLDELRKLKEQHGIA